MDGQVAAPVFGAGSFWLVMGAALVVGVTITVLTLALVRPHRPVTGVQRSLSLITGGLPGSTDQTADLTARDRIGRPLLAWLQSLGRRLTPVGTPARLRRRLDLAGNPSGWDIETLFACKAAGSILGVGAAVLILVTKSSVLAVLLACLVVAGGYWITDILLYNAALHRQEELRNAAPDAIDMLTVCVEAGLGFDAALAQVSRNTTGPLAAELARLLQEMQIGRSRAEAFHDFTTRTDVPELTNFVNAIVQADKLGVPITQVLREQSSDMRLRRRQRAEEQAQKVPVKIIFPVIVCIFPALMIVVIGPGALQVAKLFGTM
jgi:tight adherence protein C